MKHWMEHHPSLDKFPPFRYRIKRTFKDCLSRQIHEAVAIFLAEEPLLNGKNEYMNNCISRVTVNEDNFERKKRELKEEREENERLIKLEAFKNEKYSLMNGIKRKRNVVTPDRNDNKHVKMLNPENDYYYVQDLYRAIPSFTEDPVMVLCDTQHTSAHHTVPGSTQCLRVTSTAIRSELYISSLHSAWSKRSTCTDRQLAIEYFPGEGGDCTPIDKIKLPCNIQNVQGDDDQGVNNIQEVSTGKSDAAGPPQRGGRISRPTQAPRTSTAQPQQVKVSGRYQSTPHQPQLKNKLKDNYICNLYGWSAWWERVTRKTCRPKKSLVTLAEKVKLSEVEKSRFVNRYYDKY